MGVLQAGFDANFAEEALGPERGGQLGREHLDRYVAAVLSGRGPIDVGHAAAADLSIDLVAIRECSSQAIELIHHGGHHVPF